MCNQKTPRHPDAPKAVYLPVHDEEETREEVRQARRFKWAAGGKNTGSTISGCHTYQLNGTTHAEKRNHPSECRNSQRPGGRHGRHHAMHDTPAQPRAAHRIPGRHGAAGGTGRERWQHHAGDPAYRPAQCSGGIKRLTSQPLGCSFGSCLNRTGGGFGQFWCISEHKPSHIGAQVFAPHLAASGLLDQGTAFSGNCAQTIGPLANCARSHAQFSCKLNLSAGLEIGFEIHTQTLALLSDKRQAMLKHIFISIAI